MLHARDDYQERVQDSAHLIPEDEPVFLIRAQDVCAARVLDCWIGEAEDHGADESIIKAAEVHLERIIEWQRSHGMKIPDMPQIKGEIL